METYLTKRQVADMWQVNERTVYIWMKEGLPHFRRGKSMVRFDPKAVEDWLKSKEEAKEAGVAANGG